MSTARGLATPGRPRHSEWFGIAEGFPTPAATRLLAAVSLEA